MEGDIVKKVIIKGDTNDADYVTSENELDDLTEAMVRRVAAAIKLFGEEMKAKGRKYGVANWPTSEYADGSPKQLYEGKLDEDDIEWFDDMAPHGEQGIHTVESIRIVVITEDEDLLS
jgi:hypothetical protein